MSKFQIDKFITYVEGYDQEVRDYVADPPRYVTAWEERARSARLPTPNSGTFTEVERHALASRDHAELYRLGAHPYVLWHFVEATRVWTGEAAWLDMTRTYREDVSPHGMPDFAT
jgi:hypothetical protein